MSIIAEEAAFRMDVRPKVRKRDPERDKYIESHELSLLSLLAKKHPKKAVEFGEKELLTTEKP